RRPAAGGRPAGSAPHGPQVNQCGPVVQAIPAAPGGTAHRCWSTGGGGPASGGPAGGSEEGQSVNTRPRPGVGHGPPGRTWRSPPAEQGTDVATVAPTHARRPPAAPGRAGPHRPAPRSDPRLVPSGPPLGGPP